MAASKVNYGLDAPGVVRNMYLAGLAALLLAFFGIWRHSPAAQSAGFWMAGSFFVTGSLMIASSRIGKLYARDRLLDGLGLLGDETLLDVGCGHGLLLIEAARRLPRGRAVGIDLWSQTDQAGNTMAATRANAELEGVADRVEVRDGDMRRLPFEDASFDAVVSTLAIHNVAAREERGAAIAEIVRVLRPGGQVAIADIANVAQYAVDLRRAGMSEVRIGWSPWIFPPTRTVTARKA